MTFLTRRVRTKWASRFGVFPVAAALARKINWRAILGFAALFLLASLIGERAANAESASQSLLAGMHPVRSEGVTHSGRLTDGILSNEGDEWLTDLTSRLSSRASFVEYDLGKAQTVRCVLVQADGNEVGLLSGSLDGQAWQPLLQVGAFERPGMFLRSAKLEVTVRYLKLSANGGAAYHGVGEIAAYSECPEPWPAELPREHGTPVGESIDTNILLFGVLVGLFVLVHRGRGTKLQYFLLAPALVVGWKLVGDLIELFDFNREPPLRAMVAALAAVVLIREVFLSKRWPSHRVVTLATLWFCAATAFGTYYHFGMSQFFDHAKGRRTFVHTFDMRHYFPVAKYFPELRYDGLYVASLAAYMDNTPDFPREQLDQVRMRDLRNSEIRSGSELASELPEIRSRFTPQRWGEFKRDMKYFADTMGSRDYLGSLADHGANATPVWIVAAHLIFKNVQASEVSLSLAGLIDPVLVLFLFFVVARTFGVRVMLYLIVIWGATDFYTFTANLMGSTLRQDWLVALGLGVCALKKERHFLGGALVAYSGLIRAFPALSAFFFIVPMAWFAFDHWWRKKSLPSMADWRASQRPALRACFGAAVCVVTLVALPSVMFGFGGSWIAWQQKIGHHATDPSTNNVGLRNVLAFDSELSASQLIANGQAAPDAEWVRTQRSTFDDRRPWFYCILTVATALAVLACRGRGLEQAALIGLLLVPFYFYPSNYYCHFVFLLPLVVTGPLGDRERTFAWVFIVLAALCVGQVFTLNESWIDLRYTYQSYLLLIAFAAILAGLARQSLSLFPFSAPTQQIRVKIKSRRTPPSR